MENFRNLALGILEKTDMQLALIPHVVWKGNDDRTALRALAEDPRTHGKIWVRMPLIKDVNDGDETIQAALDLLEELAIGKVSLLGYHEMGVAKARNAGLEFATFEAPAPERMEEIRDRFLSAGIDVEISGART